MRRLCWRISDIYNGFRSLFIASKNYFLAPIPAGTFTIFSLFRVPVRFVLCPSQHPRLPCGSRRYRMRAHGKFTVSRYPALLSAGRACRYKSMACALLVT